MKFTSPLALLFAVMLLQPVSSLAMPPSVTSSDVESSVGTVGEKIDVPSYSYLWLEDKGIWIAAPTLQAAKGDQVEYGGAMEMSEFYSRALDRTFDSIWFVQDIKVVKRDVESMHRQALDGGGMGHEAARPKETASAPSRGEIGRLDGGKTVEEILGDPTGVAGRSVSLRAKVLKVNLGIAGANWVTLSDGTGEQGSNTLLATSDEAPAAGDIVVATGTIGTDIDIGSGYRYEVLLQDATFITRDG